MGTIQVHRLTMTVIETLEFFEAATSDAAQISPSDNHDQRHRLPDNYACRYQVPSGIHFGQGPVAVLSHDPQEARVLQSSVLLMSHLLDEQGTAPPERVSVELRSESVIRFAARFYIDRKFCG